MLNNSSATAAAAERDGKKSDGQRCFLFDMPLNSSNAWNIEYKATKLSLPHQKQQGKPHRASAKEHSLFGGKNVGFLLSCRYDRDVIYKPIIIECSYHTALISV